MSYATTPCYLHSTKGWEARFREHPAIDWMMDYERAFDWGDMKSGPHNPWHSDDYTYTKPTGETITGGPAAWAAICQMFAPFTATYLEPFFFVIWDTPTGYEFLGFAKLFAKLPVPGEQTKTDLEGRKWDIEAPAASHFVIVKDPSGPKGLKMKAQTMFADGSPMFGEMIKRGMIKPEQFLAQLS